MNVSVNEIFDLAPPGLDGRPRSLAEFRGRVLLIVNTASACGFTPQMKSLAELRRVHHDRGFEVLGFPSNDFRQEPLDAAALATGFCEAHGVNFPLFAPTQVRGRGKHPLFATLTEAGRGLLGREILWNFEKFLVDHEGALVGRWRSLARPDGRGIRGAVEAALARRTGAPR